MNIVKRIFCFFDESSTMRNEKENKLLSAQLEFSCFATTVSCVYISGKLFSFQLETRMESKVNERERGEER